ncbi:MAG: hypothetical protein KatS3mg016_0330 [Fimbriimonadales bacterium]|nr:MAG: hypothetical protein KatS3mg016_0330 [Fimbriimonadales bacterium]
MSLRGVIRGRTIELEEDPHLPDGTTVEVELLSVGDCAAQPQKQVQSPLHACGAIGTCF